MRKRGDRHQADEGDNAYKIKGGRENRGSYHNFLLLEEEYSLP